jgi:hypothetical protein
MSQPSCLSAALTFLHIATSTCSPRQLENVTIKEMVNYSEGSNVSAWYSQKENRTLNRKGTKNRLPWVRMHLESSSCFHCLAHHTWHTCRTLSVLHLPIASVGWHRTSYRDHISSISCPRQGQSLVLYCSHSLTFGTLSLPALLNWTLSGL